MRALFLWIINLHNTTSHNTHQYHGYTWSWAGKVCRAGNFSGAFCVWCVEIMWPNPSAVEHVKCAKRYGEMSRVLAVFVWPLSIDWPERKCEKNIFTHQTQTPPEKLPALQIFPAHDQVYPWCVIRKLLGKNTLPQFRSFIDSCEQTKTAKLNHSL